MRRAALRERLDLRRDTRKRGLAVQGAQKVFQLQLARVARGRIGALRHSLGALRGAAALCRGRILGRSAFATLGEEGAEVVVQRHVALGVVARRVVALLALFLVVRRTVEHGAQVDHLAVVFLLLFLVFLLVLGCTLWCNVRLLLVLAKRLVTVDLLVGPLEPVGLFVRVVKHTRAGRRAGIAAVRLGVVRIRLLGARWAHSAWRCTLALGRTTSHA